MKWGGRGGQDKKIKREVKVVKRGVQKEVGGDSRMEKGGR